MSASVTLKNLTVSYNRHPAIHHINGQFAAGSLTAIAGANGAGKSSLLKAIVGINQIESGEVIIDDATQNEIGYLPQVVEVDRDFPLTIKQMVATGFWNKTGAYKKITKQMQDEAEQAIEAVGLSGVCDKSIASLSSGQFQRAMFARLLVQNAKLILLDEPFSAIDTETTESLMKIVQKWHQEGRTIIAVLHDFEQIKRYFPEALLLASKVIAWGKTNEVLSLENLVKAKSGHKHSHEVCDV